VGPNPLLAACKEHGMRLTLYGLLDEGCAVVGFSPA
jgi:hypothetical protein